MTWYYPPGCSGTDDTSHPLDISTDTEAEVLDTPADLMNDLARMTPSNAELSSMADRFPAPQEWYDE